VKPRKSIFRSDLNTLRATIIFTLLQQNVRNVCNTLDFLQFLTTQ